MRVWISAGMALTSMLALAACGDRASAVETRDRSEAPAETPAPDAGPRVAGFETGAGRDGPDKATVLTANRRESVDEKIQRLYERNGSDFDARSAEDFLDKVTAFTRRPPADTETVTRPNGDTLLYQASTNTFAVVARNGAPRTMFKPDDGPAYWAEQKAAAPTVGRPRAQD